MEPGAGSPIVELLFTVFLIVLFGAVAFVLLRIAAMMSLLWLLPLARVFSFVPVVRRWIDRKTAPR